VSDYYTNTYPGRLGQTNPSLYQGLGSPIPVVHTFDAETKEMMRQALKLLDKIDKRLGDVECQDAAKAAFMKSLDLDPTNIGG
jgi:hypothetical protein